VVVWLRLPLARKKLTLDIYDSPKSRKRDKKVSIFNAQVKKKVFVRDITQFPRETTSHQFDGRKKKKDLSELNIK